MIDILMTSLWTFVESISAVCLFDSFSERRYDKPTFSGLFFVCILLDMLFFRVFVHLSENLVGKLIESMLFFSLLHIVLYKGSILFNLFIVTVYYSWSCCIDNLLYILYFTLSPTGKSNIDFSHQTILAVIIHGLVFGLCYFVHKTHIYSPQLYIDRRWYAISTIVSCACLMLLFYLGISINNGTIDLPLALACAAFVSVMNILTFNLMSWMEQNARLKEETLSLQSQINAQQEGIEALSASYATQRKMTHDFNAHMNAIEAFLKNDEIPSAKKYVEVLQAAQTERILLVNTHNSTMDAILNQKALIAQKYGIDIRFTVNDLSGIRIASPDLTVIISNLMDNAIEACQKLSPAERMIYVQAILEDEFFFSVRNRSLPTKIVNDQIATTKSNPSMHGYGLQNVKTILKKYNAYYSMRYENGYFSFSTEISNTLIS